MAIVRLEGLGKQKKNHLIGTRSRYLPAYSIVLQTNLHFIALSVYSIVNKHGPLNFGSDLLDTALI
jgi:hypothetical protein